MMKKVGKTIAAVIDLAFIPIRFIVVIEMALTSAVLYDDDISLIKACIIDGIAGVKIAFRNVKPMLKSIWYD